jgi:hypothetical protein
MASINIAGEETIVCTVTTDHLKIMFINHITIWLSMKNTVNVFHMNGGGELLLTICVELLTIS